MDKTTVEYYDQNAVDLAKMYELADVSHTLHLLIRHLPQSGTILDIGCGSGRVASFLANRKYGVVGVDASKAMIDTAQQLHPAISGKLQTEAIPFAEESNLFAESFDAVISIETFMHLPEQNLFDAAFQIRRLLRSEGILFLSISTGRSELFENRDRTGCLFIERSPEQMRLLFERIGFRFIALYSNPDAYSRGICGKSLVFQLDSKAPTRSIDQIETIIRRDRKDATYKLALIRALCEIAQSENFMARWYINGKVGVPLGLIAEK